MSIYDNPAFKDPQVQLQFLMFLIEGAVALWVVNDARTRNLKSSTAYWWGLGTLLIFPIVLPVWFFLRPKTTSSTRSTASTMSSPFTSLETTGTPIPQNGDKGRSKICDSCGKFYLGEFEKCPHCNAPIRN